MSASSSSSSPSSQKLEDLNLSSDEIRRLGEAFQKEEFRKLFAEYAEEISDPSNRAQYEKEIRQLEKERGMDVRFVNPEPGYVIKTTVDGSRKAFINICKNDNIAKPSSEKKVGENGTQGLSWSIPHSFAPPREDVANGGTKCTIYDFVVHPDTYRMAETNQRFKSMVNNLAFDGIRKQFDAKLDTKNVKFPKMKYKGNPTPTVIRSRLEGGGDNKNIRSTDPNDILASFPYPYDETSSEEKAKRNEENNARKANEEIKKSEKTRNLKGEASSESESSKFTTPHYMLKHRSEIDMKNFTLGPDGEELNNRPTSLVVEVDLPLLRSASPISLDIFERQLVLQSTEPARYKLDLALPYPVDENLGSARFDKAKRRLIVTLPVIAVALRTHSLCDQLSSDRENGTTAADDKSREMLGSPLIEVISETAANRNQESKPATNHNRDSKPTANHCQDFQLTSNPEVNLVTSQNQQSETGDFHKQEVPDDWESISIPCEESPARDEVSDPLYVLPDYEECQDDATLTFVFNVAKVKAENMTVGVLSANVLLARMISIGDGHFPVHYSCALSFSESCRVADTDACHLDTSGENVVLVVRKAAGCTGAWSEYNVGTTVDKMEPRRFETEQNLMNDLDTLDAEVDSSSTRLNDGDSKKKKGGQLAKLEVTHMDMKKLVLKLKKEEDVMLEEVMKNEDKTPPVIVHDSRLSVKCPPPRGILKQRSVSESSDSTSPSCCGHRGAERQMSVSSGSGGASGGGGTTTGSDDDDDDDGDDENEDDDEGPLSSSVGSSSNGSSGSAMKKSVSFNERVDRTLYSSTQSVSAMHAALKAKRRRARKIEAKVGLKMEREESRRRRRRSSGSGSLDSGDEPSGGVEGAREAGQKCVGAGKREKDKCPTKNRKKSTQDDDEENRNKNDEAERTTDLKSSQQVELSEVVACSEPEEATEFVSGGTHDSAPVEIGTKKLSKEIADDVVGTSSFSAGLLEFDRSGGELSGTICQGSDPVKGEGGLGSLSGGVPDKLNVGVETVSNSSREIGELNVKSLVERAGEWNSGRSGESVSSCAEDVEETAGHCDNAAVSPSVHAHDDDQSSTPGMAESELQHGEGAGGSASTEGKAPRSTVLDWSEAPSTGEHRTRCAFDLTNSVMFELDVE